MAAAPLAQTNIVDRNKDKPFAMIGVDIWNGSATELARFQFVTQVKFPLLQKGSNPEIPWGLDTSNLIIVDPDGITRGIESIGDYDEVNALIDLILDPVPVSDLKPKSLYYGTRGDVGVQRQITLTIENTGLKTLEVTGIRSSTDQISFDQTSLSVEPSTTGQIVITLNPTEAGIVSGTVTVTTNDKDWTLPITSIEIVGALPPAIALTDESVDFGSVEVGRSQSRAIEIRNEGLGPLTVSGVEGDLPGLTVSDQTFTLGAGQTRAINVSVQPPGEGAFSGAVTISSDDPDRGSVTVNIVGTGQIIQADTRTDFDGSGSVDFGDFLGFAGAFGTGNANYDVDGSGTVDFADFLIFVENFGRSAAM